jgi:Kef-type K+ transport system membrane component KefB
MVHPLGVFLLQLIIIIIASRICAYLFRKIGQPSVMGEIVAGILLGPSLLGSIAPNISVNIFPVVSLGNLQMLSQVGLILFMFVIGMELDLNIIKKKAKAAVLISTVSIVLPYSLGVWLAYYLYRNYAPANVSFYAFALFMGIAMSITAFPVLARIIRERGLTNTKLGAISICSAAINDVAGWCILAFVIAIAKAQNINSAFYTLIYAAVYATVMLVVIRPFLKKLSERKGYDTSIQQSTVAVIIIILLLSSYCCELIGIHALFGAFMAGLIMPLEWDFRKLIIDKIEDVALVLLLPLFFVLTGLRTQINLLNDAGLWMTCGLITFAAIVGKFGGSAIAAKITGETTYNSLAIGALMNTRGLLELIVLNIGYDLGILTPQVFTMMVLMALITTFMTSPILDLLNKLYRNKKLQNQ